MQRILIVSLIAVFVVTAAVAVWLLADRLTPSIQSGAVISTGQAQVGGPFELADQDGNVVTDETFRGKKMLIYFGFTFCPDVCPLTLSTMILALDELGEAADTIEPVFITVDPERDTVDAVKRYVEQFSDRLVGLTGSPEQIETAARAYRVQYRKAQDPRLTDYTMEHTSIIYLMDEENRYLTHFTHETSAADMAKSLRKFLQQPS